MKDERNEKLELFMNQIKAFRDAQKAKGTRSEPIRSAKDQETTETVLPKEAET